MTQKQVELKRRWGTSHARIFEQYSIGHYLGFIVIENTSTGEIDCHRVDTITEINIIRNGHSETLDKYPWLVGFTDYKEIKCKSWEMAMALAMFIPELLILGKGYK